MNIAPIKPMTANNVAPNFKGGIKPSMISESNAFLHSANKKFNQGYDKSTDWIAKHVVAPVINSKPMNWFTKTGFCKDKKMTSYLSTLGSFVTTAFYIRQTDKTLNKNAEERKRAKTLELNQGLVTGISTVLGFSVNGLIDKGCDKLKKKYRVANYGDPKLPTKMKGFDIAKQMFIFSLMYRYIAPVIVTPLASKISKVREAKKAEQATLAQQQQQVAQQPQPQKVEVKTQSATKTA